MTRIVTTLLMLGVGVPALAEFELMEDLGVSCQVRSPDGTPDFIFHDETTGEVSIVFMHPTLQRPYLPADLNAQGLGNFYGPGTVAGVEVLDDADDVTVTDDVLELLVDDWSTGGEGFSGSLVIEGPVTEIEILDAGVGYGSGELGEFDVDNTDTGGSGLDVIYSTLAGIEGEVQDLRILSGGVGYEPNVELAIIPGNLIDHEGDPFVGVAYTNDEGVIDRVDLAERGSGYEETPSVILVGATQGSGAEIVACLAGGIDRIFFIPTNPDAGGIGYRKNPILTPQGPGEGFEYRMSRTGSVVDVEITNPGGNYDIAPLVGLNPDDVGSSVLAVLWEDLDASARPVGDQTGPVVVKHKNHPVKLSGDHWRCYAGDVDGDRITDLMWRKPKGSVNDHEFQLWIMDASCVTIKDKISNQSLPNGFRPWKLANLAGNAYKDLICWDDSTGTLGVWDHLTKKMIQHVPEGSSHGKSWQPYVVIPAKQPGVNDQILWRREAPTTFSIAQYTDRSGDYISEWEPVVDSAGIVVEAEDTIQPWVAGNVNGDSFKDLVVRDRGANRIGIWQMEDPVLLDGGWLAWENEEILARDRVRGLETYGEGKTSVATSTGGLYTVATRTTIPLQPTDAELISLEDRVESLLNADADQVTAALDEIYTLLNTSQALVNYLLDPIHAWNAFGQLSPYLAHEIYEYMLGLSEETTTIDTINTYVVESYQIVDPNGTARAAIPEVQPEPEETETTDGSDANGSSSGSGSGGQGGNASGGLVDGGAGGGDVPGGGSSGAGGGGGDSGGLPDNFDPNDPSTWPAGVDSFEELLEYLINLPT